MLREISSEVGAATSVGIRGREALGVLFDFGRSAISEMTPPQGEARGRTRSLKLGFPDAGGSAARGLVKTVEVEYPLVLKAPFEQTASIAGAVWSAHELLDVGRDDGLAKLHFDVGALDLPMHVHEFSDRFIVVLDGEGFFHVSSETLDEFSGRAIRSIPVAAGDALAFTRGLLHTFSAPDRMLVLLSYHAPLVELGDPRQYTLPTMIWTPRMVQRYHQESRGVSDADVR